MNCPEVPDSSKVDAQRKICTAQHNKRPADHYDPQALLCALQYYACMLFFEKRKRQIYQEYTNGCMFKRNRHPVDCSSVCISYLTKDTGGTAYTVKYATQNKVHVINIADLL